MYRCTIRHILCSMLCQNNENLGLHYALVSNLWPLGQKRNESRLNSRGIAPGMSRWKIVTSTDEWALREKKREREEEGRKCEVKSYKEMHSYTSNFILHEPVFLDFTKVFSWECMLRVFTNKYRFLQINVCLIDVFKILRKRSANFYEYRSSFPLHPSGVVKCLSHSDREFPTSWSIMVNDSTFLFRI